MPSGLSQLVHALTRCETMFRPKASEAAIMGHAAASMAAIKRRGIHKKREKSRVAIEAKRLPGRKKSSPKRRNKTSKKAKNGDGS